MAEGRRGAVRSEAARVAILRATSRLFADRGYDGLSMEGIAAEAGVGKQTIYRWWPSKAAVVAECLVEGLILPSVMMLANSGSIRADIVAWLDTVFALVSGSSQRSLVRSLIAASMEHPEIGDQLRQTLGAAESIASRLAAAVDAGELRPDAPLPELADALVGAVILRALSGDLPQPGDAQRLAGAILDSAVAAGR